MGFIKNHIDASDFAGWVSLEFKIDMQYVYDVVLEKDYIEGRLGSTKSIEENPKEEHEKWFNDFLINFNLEKICLKY